MIRFQIPLLAWLVLSAAPSKTPPIPTKDWTVALHDDVDESALQLACRRIGPRELQCVDLGWLLRQRDEQRERAEQVEERKEAQRKAWNCGDNVPDHDCVAGPNTSIEL